MPRPAPILLILLLVPFAAAITAPQATIIIDGTTTDWVDIPAQPINQTAGSTPSASDFSGKYKAAWDQNNLYIFAQITDDSYDITGGDWIWDHDGIEVLVDGGNEKATSYDNNDHKILAQADGNWVQVWDGNLANTSAVDAAGTQTANGYQLELAIPWSILNATPSAAKSIGFNLLANERDQNTYQGQVMWRYADSHSTDTSAWGTLTLQDQEAVCGNDKREPGEQCDDGNTNDNDWCSNSCQVQQTAHESFSLSTQELAYTRSDEQKTLGVRVADTAVYRYGYYSLDGGENWTEFELTGGLRIGDWLVGSTAHHELNLTKNAINNTHHKLVATYSCGWSSGWSCRGGDWQVRNFSARINTASEPGAVCGNGIIEAGEACDSTNISTTCSEQGYDNGSISCSDCSLNTSACTSSQPAECGNGIIEAGEQCDGSALAGATCTSEGYDNGTLGCTDTCSYDTTSCTSYVCGNGIVEGSEECDGSALAGATCTSEGFDQGSISCSDCQLNTSSCSYTSSPTNSKAGDEDALEALYVAANGNSWNTNTGWSSSGMDLNDNIHGVAVEQINGEPRVTQINLRSNGLTGSIDVPEISNLKELELFSVYLNNLDSYIPEELMALANNNLRYLYLSMSDGDDELRTLFPHEATLTGSGRIHPGKTKGSERNVFRGTLHAPPDPQNAVLEWVFVSWTDTAELAEDGIHTIEPGLFEIPTLVGVQIYENTNIGASGNYLAFPDLRVMPNLRTWRVGGGTGTPWDENRHGFFTGRVGDKVEGLSELIELGLAEQGQLIIDLDETDMSGLSSLQMVGLSSSRVQGSGLPGYFFDGTMPEFQAIYLAWPEGEGISGSLPEFSEAINLKVFTPTDHNFSGEIPASFWHQNDELINTNFGYNELTSIGTDDLTNLGSRYWKIRNLRWYNNEISGPWPKLAWGTSQLEDFTRFRVQHNRYVFRDMLYVPDNAPNGETIFELMQQEADVSFSYAPQKPFGDARSITASSGQDITLDDFIDDVSHADNQYQWERNGNPISGETSRTVTISNAQSSDSGTYTLVVDNPGVPGLTLTSEPITLSVN